MSRSETLAVRFIPACAGNTRIGLAADAVHRFIPACAGNTRIVIIRYASVIGSSPRVRGTRPSHVSHRQI